MCRYAKISMKTSIKKDSLGLHLATAIAQFGNK